MSHMTTQSFFSSPDAEEAPEADGDEGDEDDEEDDEEDEELPLRLYLARMSSRVFSRSSLEQMERRDGGRGGGVVRRWGDGNERERRPGRQTARA